MTKAGVVDDERTERIKRLVEDASNHSSAFEPGFSKCKCKDLPETEEGDDDVDEVKVTFLNQ